MSYTIPFVDDKYVPNQPLPLRLVPFITGWSVEEMLELISDDDPVSRINLPVKEYHEGAQPRDVSRKILHELKLRTRETSKPQEQIRLLRSSYYVMSSELEKAFGRYLTHIYSPDDPPRQAELTWSPATGDCTKDIEACPDFYDLMPTEINKRVRKRHRNPTNTDIYRRMCEHAEHLREKRPHLSRSDIAHIISKNIDLNPKHVTKDHITKILRNECKKFGI